MWPFPESTDKNPKNADDINLNEMKVKTNIWCIVIDNCSIEKMSRKKTTTSQIEEVFFA